MFITSDTYKHASIFAGQHLTKNAISYLFQIRTARADAYEQSQSTYGVVSVGEVHHPAVADEVGAGALGVLDRLHDAHQWNVAALSGTASK